MHRVFTALCFLSMLALAAVSVSAQGGGNAKARALKNPVPATPASIKTGLGVYNMNCRQCHGLRGKGDGPLAPRNPRPADLTDEKWDHGSTDGEIFTIIWNGAPAANTEMKGMKDTLAERDVWNVVNYIRSIGPKTVKR